MDGKYTIVNAATGDGISIQAGEALKNYKGSHPSLPNFGCCKGLCGLCLIQIISGIEGLEPHSILEKQTIVGLNKDPNVHRLACQLKVDSGFTFLPIFN